MRGEGVREGGAKMKEAECREKEWMTKEGERTPMPQSTTFLTNVA